jgi:adenosylhomocysteine nucleosidase
MSIGYRNHKRTQNKMSNILLVSATKLEHHDEELFGTPIHIVGIGKVEAAINTTNLINEYDPNIVINFGSCGNLKDHKPGEVLEVGTVYNDLYAGTLHSSLPFRLGGSDIKCFTTDTFYESNENYHHSYEFRKNNCDIVDMELYSIVYSCRVAKKIVHSFKWVSDNGDSTSWEENAALGYNNFKKLLKKRFYEN